MQIVTLLSVGGWVVNDGFNLGFLPSGLLLDVATTMIPFSNK